MTGLIVSATGWTIRELDETPWPDALDLLDYWLDCPPVHLMVKDYMGIKDHKDEAPVSVTPEQFMAMARGAGL